MNRYFTVDGRILSVNQDCSITEYATLVEAFAANPVCVLRSQSTYENMLLTNGRKEEWYQNTRYHLFSIQSKIQVEAVKIGSWFIKNLLQPRNVNYVIFDLVDPLGKMIRYKCESNQADARLTQAFLKVREVNNYESALNYALVEENAELKQEINRLKTKLRS